MLMVLRRRLYVDGQWGGQNSPNTSGSLKHGNILLKQGRYFKTIALNKPDCLQRLNVRGLFLEQSLQTDESTIFMNRLKHEKDLQTPDQIEACI